MTMKILACPSNIRQSKLQSHFMVLPTINKHNLVNFHNIFCHIKGLSLHLTHTSYLSTDLKFSNLEMIIVHRGLSSIRFSNLQKNNHV